MNETLMNIVENYLVSKNQKLADTGISQYVNALDNYSFLSLLSEALLDKEMRS